MTTTTNNKTIDEQLTFDDQIIEKTTGITTSKVSGILSLDGNMFSELADKVTSGSNPAKGINTDAGEKQVVLKMKATIKYGKSAPGIFKAVCSEVQYAINRMTGLNLAKFELHINGVKTREEVEKGTK